MFNDEATFEINFGSDEALEEELLDDSCSPSELRVVETSSIPFSPIYILQVATPQTIDLPSYELWPSCGYTGYDVTYSVREGSSLPAWATFIENENTVVIDTEESKEDLEGIEEAFKFEVRFQTTLT